MVARRPPQRRRREPRAPRPTPHWFTIGAFRTVGRRLLNPPPPSEKERYFLFVAPRYDVALEDVVAGKHLPPLSLQDFEDYLKHVEGTSQHLYFYLWLQRYQSLHDTWASTVLPTIPSTSTGGYRPRDLWERLNHCQDRTLKEEFTYAKARWFDSKATTKLDITDEMRRSVLDISNLPPPPEMGTSELTNQLPSFPNQPSPSHFSTIQQHITSHLQAALSRFLRIAFCNAGLWHACAGPIGGIILFLIPGLVLWILGVSGGAGKRRFVAGSLPLLWAGFWFIFMGFNRHCFSIWATGDARQLYPHESIRPSPPEHSTPPPVYSLSLPPNATPPPPYEPRLGRKASGILSIMSGVTGGARMGKRGGGGGSGGGILGIFGRRDDVDDVDEGMENGLAFELDTRRTMERARDMELKLPLPPARKTKDLLRQSLGPDLPLPLSISSKLNFTGRDDEPQQTVTSTADIADYQLFTEAEDFGIVVSEAYEEDEDYPYPPLHLQRIQTASSSEHEGAPGTAGLEPLVSVQVEPPTPGAGSGPENTSQPVPIPVPVPFRRGALPDIFSFISPPATATSPTAPKPANPALEWALSQSRPSPSPRRGSKQDLESGDETVILMNPQWRTMFGPMTLVHDPLVQRAHWAVVVRCAAMAGVFACAMALGLVR